MNDTKHVTYERGHQFNYLIIKVFRRAIHDFLSITVIFFWGIPRGYKAVWEKEEVPKGTSCMGGNVKQEAHLDD